MEKEMDNRGETSTADLLDENFDSEGQSAAPKKRRFHCEFPSAYTILFLLSIVVAICTYVIPAGQYERQLNEELGKQTPVPGTYKEVQSKILGVYDGEKKEKWKIMEG